MKTPIAIILASLIVLFGIVFYSLSHRYYIDSSTHLVIDRMTGEAKRPEALTPTPEPEPVSRGLFSASDFAPTVKKEPKINKGDFSKVAVSGESADDSNPYMYSVTCTVTNNDSIPHEFSIQAIFYDKDKKPILTEESLSMTVQPGDIGSTALNAFDNVESISSYELKLIQSEDDGVVVDE